MAGGDRGFHEILRPIQVPLAAVWKICQERNFKNERRGLEGRFGCHRGSSRDLPITR